MAKGKRIQMTVNILVKREGEMFVSHCLELDLVATAPTHAQATNDLLDIIREQVEYAFVNDNLDNLYHPAPAEVWREFYLAKEISPARRVRIDPSEEESASEIPPPWIISRIRAGDSSHVQ